MAAETLTSTQAGANYPVAGPGDAFNLKVSTGTYAIAANVEDGDIFEMCKVPAGAVVVGGWLIGADLDTGIEALDMDLGWASNGTDAADPDGFGNLGVLTGDVSVHLPVAGLYIPLQGVLQATGPKRFSAETTVQLEANAAATTFAAGTVSVVVLYFIDPNFTL
tara:strand:+ start:51 stop:542 length:492 start_codon:yes stop_codon:yes gene_type:complete